MEQNKKTYQYQVVVEKELQIDFEQIYNYVLKDYIEEVKEDLNNIDLNSIDQYDIIDDFGDNTDYFIEKIYGITFTDRNSDTYVDEVWENNMCLLDTIADDFGKWVEEEKIKKLKNI
jgi:hypothetical protein